VKGVGFFFLKKIRCRVEDIRGGCNPEVEHSPLLFFCLHIHTETIFPIFLREMLHFLCEYSLCAKHLFYSYKATRWRKKKNFLTACGFLLPCFSLSAHASPIKHYSKSKPERVFLISYVGCFTSTKVEREKGLLKIDTVYIFPCTSFREFLDFHILSYYFAFCF